MLYHLVHGRIKSHFFPEFIFLLAFLNIIVPVLVIVWLTEIIVVVIVPVVRIVVVAVVRIVIPVIIIVVVPVVIIAAVIIVIPVVIDVARAVGARQFADVILYTQAEFTFGDDIEVIFDDLVIGVFLVPVLIGELHIVAYTLCEGSSFLGIFYFYSLIYECGYIFAIVAVPDLALRIFERFRLLYDLRLGRLGVRRVDIEFELADHEKVVPQLMPEVIYVTQVRIELAHQLYDLACGLVATFAVFYFDTVVYYAFDVAAIFAEHDLFSYGIIFHYLFDKK